jgi:outer membrane protein
MRNFGGTKCLGLAAALCAAGAAANDDPLSFLLDVPGSAGLGFASLWSESPYIGGGTRTDLLPLYLYEGDRFFLRSTRAGFKLWQPDDAQRLELFIARRLEGYPEDRRPEILDGMAMRSKGVDLGLRYRWQPGASTWSVSAMHDLGSISNGAELRADYAWTWQSERWALQPGVGIAWRSAHLNDYYFGVTAAEATLARPAYHADSGFDTTASLYASYRILRNWRVVGGVSSVWHSSEIEDSPLVRTGTLPTYSLGAVYDFGSHQVAWEKNDAAVTYWKVLYGRASAYDCHLVKIMTLSCTDLDHELPSAVAGIQFGRPFITALNGWPLDFVGYVGLLRRDERGQQQNAWQLDAYMKAYYYGFPWRAYVQTRFGFGFGLSYAERVPYAEVSSQAARERSTSHLLNYLDPSIDVNVGDLLRSESLRKTWIGLGVSHRSGIFASSRLLGNVNGGSNYIYVSIETAL